jgi:hypothetical protein
MLLKAVRRQDGDSLCRRSTMRKGDRGFTRNTFVIESELSKHRLILNGQEISTLATLDEAEAAARKIAGRIVSNATLRFELDFKWTCSDLEIRAAILESKNELYQEEFCLCGS